MLYSCSTVVRNVFYIFGGSSGQSYENQVSILGDCGLTRVASLTTRFNQGGACHQIPTSSDYVFQWTEKANVKCNLKITNCYNKVLYFR